VGALPLLLLVIYLFMLQKLMTYLHSNLEGCHAIVFSIMRNILISRKYQVNSASASMPELDTKCNENV
jgi:hypothetical protein